MTMAPYGTTVPGGIRTKLVAGFTVLVAIIALFVFLYFPRRFEDTASTAIASKARTIVEMAAYGATAGVVFEDREAVAEVLAAVRQNPDVVFAVVTDTADRVLAEVRGPAAAGVPGKPAEMRAVQAGRLHIAAAPVTYLGSRIGTVEVGLSLASMQANVQRSRLHVAIVSLLILATGFGGVLALSTLVLGPLRRIVRTTEKVAAGDLTERTGIASRDELGFLGHAFDRMVERLEKADAELRAVNRELEERVKARTVDLEREVDERRRAEDALRESEHQFRTMIESAAMGVALVDMDGRVIETNPALGAMVGRGRDAILTDSIGNLLHAASGEPWTGYRAIVCGDVEEVVAEVSCRGSEDTVRWGRAVASAVRDRAGTLRFALLMIQDITEQKLLEQQLLQSQKLEAVGRLAGGIAHDFNNLLTTINGMSALILESLDAGDRMRADLEEIRLAGERAATLTAQLLAFSRKQIVQPEVLDLNVVIRDLGGMLRRMIGEDIVLELDVDAPVPAVRADRGHITQVAMNLAINARDAMPTGGRLRIATDRLFIDGLRASRLGTSRAGEFVRITVEDTGHGMDEQTLARIFEPFFTTKGVGKGTGLGLATVYGVVKQAGGAIEVHSRVGEGARFSVFLPALHVESGSAPLTEQVPSRGGGETILVVEDEDAVRTLIARILRTRGYHVLEAGSGQAAVESMRQHPGAVDLVLSDVIMPGMSGPELIRRLTIDTPDLRVIYMSGYTQDEVLHHGVRQDVTLFLEKPMTPGALTARVREALDAPDRMVLQG